MRGTKKDNLIIIRSDGGICSQIAFCSLGYYLEQKGYKVKYDLNWFKQYGKDMNGIFARNYDMDKAFPSLNFEEATPEEISLYSKKYKSLTDNIDEFCPPLYVGGYPDRFPIFAEYKDVFAKVFTPVDIENCQDILEQIKNSNSCAIHVRRGDLAVYNSNYGYPCSEEYFIKAIKVVSALDKNIKFFFFSDEPKWIQEHIIPKLDNNINWNICTSNASDKGYLDLYLISQCKHIIASKGSLAVYGKIFSQNNGYFVAPITKTLMSNYCDNCIFISEEKVLVKPIEETSVLIDKKKKCKLKRFFINFVPSKTLRKKLRGK